MNPRSSFCILLVCFAAPAARTVTFWAAIVTVITLRLILTSDFSVLILYGPHDDGLYVSRAYHLLIGEAFGPYDARTLVKLPGMSLWLAANRLLGVPYLLGINLVYVAAGGYFMTALARAGVRRPVILGAFALYLFNPVTLSTEWQRILREPLATCLLVLLFGAMIYILAAARERRTAVLHTIVFSVVFAFALLVREEDPLLYAAWALFSAALAWQITVNSGFRSWVLRIALSLIIVLPPAAAAASNFAARSYIAAHYGMPILHDLGEGEFPKLIAAIRSVKSKKDNRMVWVTQEALGRLKVEVPRFEPVIKRLPRPGPNSYSCEVYRLCTEWGNGHVLFWIKDAASQAGLTPDLPRAQEYFRNVRLDIERACQEGRLNCRDKGAGMFPPFELRWTRAYVNFLLGLFRRVLLPEVSAPVKPPAVYGVDADYGRMYQIVTMTHRFDSEFQTSSSLLAQRAASVRPYINPIAHWRDTIIDIYQRASAPLLICGLLICVIRIRRGGYASWSPLETVATLATVFMLLRLLVLSYVLLYMGEPDMRVLFSTYAVLMLMLPLMIMDTLVTLRMKRA